MELCSTALTCLILEIIKSSSLKVGDRATLGIRPEHLRIDADNPTLLGEVLVVERLGGATYLYVKIAGGDTLIVQADGDSRVKVHDHVPIHIDGTLCHLFDSAGLVIPKAERHRLTLEHPPANLERFNEQSDAVQQQRPRDL